MSSLFDMSGVVSPSATEFAWNRLEKPFTCLAPMEDVTDTVFRRIVARAARPDVFFTEFTSADGLQSPGREEVALRLEYTEEERPIVAQIWGADPENFYKTAIDLVDRGFDGIDINMGCPVEKIVKKGCCGALCRDRARAAEMILATKAGAKNLPVSVKTRLGYDRPDVEGWCGFLLTQQIDALSVHGRTVVQQSEGAADWVAIAQVVALRDAAGVDVAVIGNGDVTDRAEVPAVVDRTGVDGVMIGRGVFADIYIFDRTGSRPSYHELPVNAKLDALKRHIALYQEWWGSRRNFHILKKFVKTYISGFPHAAAVRDGLMDTNDYGELVDAVEAARPTS